MAKPVLEKPQFWGCKWVETQPDQIPNLTADIERSMNNSFLQEYEEQDDKTPKNTKIVVPPLHREVIHAINLHKYTNNLTEISKQKAEKFDLMLPRKPLFPLNTLNFSALDFKRPNPEIINLSKTVTKQIVIKSIATLFAHIGYETSQQSCIDVLVDVLQQFYWKIAHNLKVAIDDSETRHFNGFPHVIERVLIEMGIGGVKALDDYYKNQIINYNNVLESRCKGLHAGHQSSSVPRTPSPIDKINKVVRVKVEEEDVVEVENPEVHFSTIDGDVNLSILETGYQLLNSLEAETNLQSLGEGVDDISATESPGVAQIVGEDDSHLGPFSKKKRFK